LRNLAGKSDRRNQIRSYRILIVEDDSIQAAALAEFLRALRYEPLCASNTLQAMPLIEESPPDLVLVDAHLDTWNEGIDLVRRLRRDFPALTMVVLSADGEKHTLLEALKAGADEFLRKPTAFAELSIRIQNMLQLVELRNESAALAARLSQEREILARYFSPRIVESILQDGSSTNVGGRYLQATVLLYDLRNSTGIAETMGPADFAELVNQLTVDLMDLITSSGGSIVKLTGDGILALFTDPGRTGAASAVGCAGRISDYHSAMEPVLASSGTPLSGFGIGLATGQIFAGNIGTFRRMEFTIVGDAVERARRLEELTKRIGREILADKITARLSQADLDPVPVLVRQKRTTIFTRKRK
jgi:adenylate cyclase